MCNCGKKRDNYRNEIPQLILPIAGPMQAADNRTVNFQYTGATGLTVTGSVSGRKYRFNYSGDIQPINVADKAGMSGIAVLKMMQ